MKKKVLIFSGFYIPSVKGGGPIQSLKNLVDNLHKTIDFYIVAGDRDLGDRKAFANLQTDEWIQVGNAKVFYTNTETLNWKKTLKIFKSVNYDLVYLNSFFSYKFSTVPLIMRKLKKIDSKLFIVAPRGQFSTGALNLKNNKKKIFLEIGKRTGLYKDVKWHATAANEKKEIQKMMSNNNITVAENLTMNYQTLKYDKKVEKQSGYLRAVFISRIHPKKNLLQALQLLKSTFGQIEFNIFGPIEDEEYWNKCKKEIEGLPENISVKYHGIINHDRVLETFKQHHVFLFPTLGENFGHVISEALIGGCLVIVSDQTPWRNLEQKGVGWDIPLIEKSSYTEALNKCVNLSSDEFLALSNKAFQFAKSESNIEKNISNYNKLFEFE